METFLETVTVVGREPLMPQRVENKMCVKVIKWSDVNSGHGREVGRPPIHCGASGRRRDKT